MQYNGIKIRKRKDGRWEAKKQINKERFCVIKNTQKEVYEILKEKFPKQNKIEQKQITFYEFWNYWIEKYKAPNIKKNTLKNYYSVFKNQIQPNIKDKPIKDIKLSEINILINSIKQDRMKEYTSQFLRECFKQAFRENKIKFDFWNEIIKYHHKRKEGTALTEEQRKILLRQSNNIKHGNIFKFYLFSGVRLNEALTIKTEDIEKNLIKIRGTKTKESERYIPRFKQLNDIINNIDLTKEKLFNISEATLKREKEKLKKLCGFNFNIKDLRTTFATMCAENGIAPKIIAKWLGHTTTNTTNKYYIKILDKFENEQKNQIENAFCATFAPQKETEEKK